MATIKVDVVSAEEHIFSGEAELVSLPGTSGELGIMPGHLPLCWVDASASPGGPIFPGG